MSKLQNEDFKSEAQLTGAGGTVSQLLNDTKIYVTAGSINKKLSSAIEDGDIGGGGGGINYIDNGRAASATTGWTTYADAAGALPVDGTGGSPNVTWTRSTTTPLRDAADFNFAKDAVNRQGQGVSYAFTIDRADQAKVMTISADYEVVSGTYASGDLTVYIYDVTNAQVIQPAGFSIENVVGQGREIATFQTASNSTSYRLIFHVATTSASAYTLAFDNISVGPQVIAQGTPVTDWVSFTPTGSWTTNTTYAGRWRRVGDQMEVNWSLSLTGAPSAGTLTINLPSGFSIDTSKLAGGTAGDQPLGNGHLTDAGTADYPVSVLYSSTTAVRLRFWDDTVPGIQGVAGVQPTAPFTFANTDAINVFASVTIVGWSSNLQMSSDTDTRVVAMRAGKAGGSQTSSGSFQDFASFNAATFDTHAGFNATTGVYTVAVPGFYQVDSFISFDGNTTGIRVVELQKNGSGVEVTLNRQTADANGNYMSGSCTVSCVAGDTLRLRVFQNSGGSLAYNSSATSNYFNVSRISGPSQIAASELIAGYAYRATDQTGVNTNNSSVKITFNTVTGGAPAFDSHNAFDTANNRWIAPSPGRYRVNCCAVVAGTNVTNNLHQLRLHKNGSFLTTFDEQTPATSTRFAMEGSVILDLLSGEFVEVFLFGAGNNSVNNLTILHASNTGRFTFERL